MASKPRRTVKPSAIMQKAVCGQDIPISWQIKHLFGIPLIPELAFPENHSELYEILSELVKFESMNMNELINCMTAGKGNAEYCVYKLEKNRNELHPAIIEYLEKTGFDQIHRFRIGGRKRIYVVPSKCRRGFYTQSEQGFYKQISDV